MKINCLINQISCIDSFVIVAESIVLNLNIFNMFDNDLMSPAQSLSA